MEGKFGKSDNSWKHELGKFKDSLCYLCLADSVTTSSSLTQEVAGLNNIFYKYFIIEFSEFRENIQGKISYVTFHFLHIIIVLTYLPLNFLVLLFAQMATPFPWHLFHLFLQISFHDGLSYKFALFCNLQTKPSFRMNSNIFSIQVQTNPEPFQPIFGNMIPAHGYCRSPTDIQRNVPFPIQLVCKFIWYYFSFHCQFSNSRGRKLHLSVIY